MMSLGSEKQEMVPHRLSKAAQKFTKLFHERTSVWNGTVERYSNLHVVAVNICCCFPTRSSFLFATSFSFLHRFA